MITFANGIVTENLIVEASSLSLNDVHRFLKLEKLSNPSFTDFLSLEPLSEFEQ
ncbi:MAG: hypothetical protein V7K92_12955 [Nostoc sp.]|uniref:hypothetical protein n=1 Tax=Nostoc sp. TaxID=1180 RepID=UPI002FF19DCD